MRRRKILCILCAAALLLGGVGAGGADAVPPWSASASGEADDFLDARFHEELAQGKDGVLIDLSSVSEGYVAVSAVCEHRLKFQVIMGEEKYNYDMASDGTPSVFPLQFGDGLYRFRVMENVADNKYGQLYSVEREVTLSDEFQPFLRPSDYVSYTRESECVRRADMLAVGAGSSVDIVASVFTFICRSVIYDREKAMNVRSGYIPSPDATLASGTGICFDYASLAAAMLRSQGIPTKLIFGYVSPNDVYHAWNMFYTPETGWVTVSYQVSADSWNRLDLTFSANGADDSFIGDGGNYSDVYFY